MEEGRAITDLNVVERAWETSKAYQNSNSVQRYNGALDMDRCETVYNMVQKEFKNLDTKSSDNLRKYIKIPMQVGRRAEELGGNVEVDLILDSKGHDIGIKYIDENGPHFILSPKIKESNEKILEKFEKVVEEKDLEEFRPNSFEDVVELMAKGKNIGLTNEKEVLERLEERKPGSKNDIKDKQEELDKQDELDEEERDENESEKGMDEIPEEQKSEIAEICKKTGRKMSDLKQSLTITHPGTIIDDIDNDKTNIDEFGGEVLALRFRNKEAAGGADEVVLIQDGQVLPEDKRNNAIMSNLMEQNKGNGIKVHDFRDNREEDFKEDVQDILDFAEEKKQMLRSGNTPNLEEELKKVDEVAMNDIKDLAESMKPQSKEMENVVNYVEDKKEEVEEEEEKETKEEEKTEDNSKQTDDDFFDELGRRRRLR